jgi:DNA-binding response OmpR family regulator
MPPQRPAARILLVEDYVDAREMYAEMLEVAGYVVVTAKDGQEGIDVAFNATFDVLVLDIALPKIGGVEVIKRLRSREATAHLPIIAVSALVSPELHKIVLAAGANVALDKPLLPRDLERAVKALLEQSTRRRPAEPRT